MFDEKTLRILAVAISLVFAFYWIISLGNLAWLHPDKFEKIMSKRAGYHALNAYGPKYNWKAIIWMARLFTLIGVLTLLALLLGLLGIIK